jgi:hypothetical protein
VDLPLGFASIEVLQSAAMLALLTMSALLAMKI